MPDQNDIEFNRLFPDEEACVDYLFSKRWPDGFECPNCHRRGRWELKGYIFECIECHKQTSITAGTVMHKTRKPLKVWFKAFWWYSNKKNKITVLGLKELLNLNSYQTAWSWLQKIRSSDIRITQNN